MPASDGRAVASATELRLLSWNVRSLRDGPEQVAAVIADADVDVALIQEAPRWLRWRSKRAALARRSGLVVGTADRVGGLCVLTSLRTWVSDHELIELTRTPRLHRRALLLARVSVAGGPTWQLAVTHLGLDADERDRHSAEIQERLAGCDERLVVAGDLNEEPGAGAWTRLSANRIDAFAGASPAHTFPAVQPSRRIDTVFASPDVTVAAAEVVDSAAVRAASDHLPLVATLRS